jgi:L-threonylcarbamoyladenylate synthase
VSKIFPPTDEAIARAAEHLTRGELIGMPTETVYGIAANAMNPGAVAKIFAAKGRPSTNPLIVHLSDASDLGKVISDRIERSILDQIEKLSPYWPGPLTLVLPRSKEVPDIVTAGHSTVAVRVPENEIARKLIRQCGFPLAAPSANRSKYVSPTQASHVEQGLGNHVAMILDGGPCEVGIESTIVRLDGDHATLLRPGIITQEDLTDRLQVEVRDVPTVNSESTDLIAPGMMHQHYSPRTPSRLVTANLFTASDAASMPPRCGRIAFEPLPTEITTKYAVVEILSSTGNLAEVARKLFASLRKMDDSDLEMIHIDRCPEHGLGLAIMDRLRRATASERP